MDEKFIKALALLKERVTETKDVLDSPFQSKDTLNARLWDLYYAAERVTQASEGRVDES